MKLIINLPATMPLNEQIEFSARVGGYICPIGYRIVRKHGGVWILKSDLGGEISPKVCGDFVRDFYSEGFDYPIRIVS